MTFLLQASLFAALAVSYQAGEMSLNDVVQKVNTKMVKIYGSGGFKGLPAYGTGVLVSPNGYVLTVANHLMETTDLRVHLYDGTRLPAKLIAMEPELDIALLKIGTDKSKIDDLPFYDIVAAAKTPLATPGTSILAFSNQFQIASRDEPVSVMKGTIAAYARLFGRIGIFEAPYSGNVYVVDAITNNPGAAGGIITNRMGNIIGIIGKELRNEQTNTWINYAVPINAELEIKLADGSAKKISITNLIEKKEAYKPVTKASKSTGGGGGYLGIVYVPNVVDRTPPYIEYVEPGSPAQKAGLLPDDLIVYVDGVPVVSVNSLLELMQRYRPQERIQLEIRRGDKLQTISIQVESPPKALPNKGAETKGN